MSLTLVVPGLLARPADRLAACEPLRAFAASGPEEVRDGLDVATLRALGIDAAVAPLRARGAGVDVRDGYWLCADPVVLVAGRDDLRLVGRVDDLDAREAAALAATLAPHVAADGLDLVVARPDAWFVRVASPPALATTTFDAALGRPLIPSLPGGADGREWQRWQTEIQMLLHAHPVNAAREARDAAPVTALWFWGGGADDAGPVALDGASAPAGRAGDLVRGLASRAGIAAEAALPPADARNAVVACAPIVGDDGFDAFVRTVLGPLVDRWSRRALDSLTLVADGGGVAAWWRAQRPSAWSRLLPRARTTSFTVPERRA